MNVPSLPFGSVQWRYAMTFVCVFLAARLPSLAAQATIEEVVCRDDYTIIQRAGSNELISPRPIKLSRQLSSKVEFTVNNTWTAVTLDSLFVSYENAASQAGSTCAEKTNVGAGLGMESTITAACTKSDTAIVRLYARDTTFSSTSAVVPSCCQSGGSTNNTLEYVVVLNCKPSCSNPVPVIVPSPPNTILSCPQAGEPLRTLSFSGGNATRFEITKAPGGLLCTLVEASVGYNGQQLSIQGELKPIGRSYNGHNWESYANDVYSTMPFDCTQGGSTCRVQLATPQQGRAYLLKSYGNTTLTARNTNARFLEKGTFGPTSTELDTFISPIDWVRKQLSDQLPVTSHRGFFREHMTQWHTETSYHSLLHAGPCKVGARYRKYAILHTDAWRHLTLKTSPVNSTNLVLSVDGQVRTVAPGPAYCGDWDGVNLNQPILNDKEYEICENPLEGVNGKVKLYAYGDCGCELYLGGVYGNPEVQFESTVSTMINLTGRATPVLQGRITFSNRPFELIQVAADLPNTTASCPSKESEPGAPEVVKVGFTTSSTGKQEYWVHTTSFQLENNDVHTPLLDGGKVAMNKTVKAPAERMRSKCYNAPRTFLNEDYCVMSDDACHTDEGPDVSINLNFTSLELMYNATGGAAGVETKYVYAIDRLRIDDVSLTYIQLPCTPGARSRWVKVSNCTNGQLWQSSTQAVFLQLITNSPDRHNPYLRDVYFPITGTACHASDMNKFGFKIEIDVTGGKVCYENQHPDNLQVYDFTYWTIHHPGNFNENKIKKFADVNKTWVLTYPGWKDMHRWHLNMNKFGNLGKLGDNTTLKGLPPALLREDIARAFGSDSQTVAAAGSVMVCGSPYEVATKHTAESGPLYKGGFDMETTYNDTSWGLSEQRRSIWIHIALNAPDQLRQRVAFALSQILVVSPGSIESGERTESFLTFYDIFVRHAFGNYFDILKEVTFSPLMGEMLTYVWGESTGYVWSVANSFQAADENYAREVVQLFSIGLAKLHINGTKQLDKNGDEIRTYTNKDITEYAKVYTGFRRREMRGNIEEPDEWENNQVDPMSISSSRKDHFPKLGLDNKYIGDGYPLCTDIPIQHFLKKGATYRLLGSNPNPDLLNEPYTWHGGAPKRLRLNHTSSSLSSALCGGYVANCKPNKAAIILDADLPCNGLECNVHEPRTFEAAPGIYFEYVRPPCVNHAFYENPRTIYRRWGSSGEDNFQCGNPESFAASTLCCNASKSWDSAWRSEMFSGERVPLKTAEARCSAPLWRMCNDTWITSADCSTNGGCDNYNVFHWLRPGCTLSVKVSLDGAIAIVHKHGLTTNKQDINNFRMVRSDTRMFFRADWVSSNEVVDDFLLNYYAKCTSLGGSINPSDGLCIFGVAVQNVQIFQTDSDLLSVDNILSKAKMGAFPPTSVGEDISGVPGVKKHPAGPLTGSTVFVLKDSFGRTRYLKNTVSVVSIGNGAGALKIRNPVSFFSLTEHNVRDARYEVDAALEHYFYHANTAPFLATRLAQRFGVSNPSPRYTEVIANAFRSGKYNEFGSGRYGCLKATVAAIFLDRESTDRILDVDPAQGSLYEPYLKLIRLMRSLEFKPSTESPFVRTDLDLQAAIGQEAHQAPSVFSFFRPEYRPAGRITSASLVSPESQVLNGPTSVNMVNTMISLLKYGLTDEYGGFGRYQVNQYGWAQTITAIGSSTNHGMNRYNSTSLGLSTAEQVVDDLATLLTGGRIGGTKRQLLLDAYAYTMRLGKGSYEAMINVQQLIVTSPEFHTSNTHVSTGPRPPTAKPPASGKPYKAILYLNLAGGADSYNILVPDECTGRNSKNMTVSEQYLQHRGSVAFSRTDPKHGNEFRLNITASPGQPCSRFAVHDELTYVKQLYDEGDLLFVANAGVVNQNSMSKYDYKTRTQVFAHNAMEAETKKVDPYDSKAGTGVLGRAKDVLETKGHVVNAMNIDESAIVLDGLPGGRSPPMVVPSGGIDTFADRPDGTEWWRAPNDEQYFDIETYSKNINSEASVFSGMFGDIWSEQFLKGIEDAKTLKVTLEDVADTSTTFGLNEPDGWDGKSLWRELDTVARLVQTHQSRNSDRDVFYVSYGGFDHHEEMKDNLRSKLKPLNAQLKNFVEQLKKDGLWDSMTIYVTSEFARTITKNSSEGTDHAWGQHNIILGGKVKGGQILGKYPNDISPDSPLDVDGTRRGRFLPTTSNDAVWNAMLQWFGLSTAAELDYCLPNRHNTIDPVLGEPSSPLLNMLDMYVP